MAAPILAAVDPLASDLAPVRFAAALAGAGAPLTLVSVVGDPTAVTALVAGQSGEELAPDAVEALERAERIARAEGVEPDSLAAAAASAPRGLSLTALELGAGLLVVGSGAGGPSGQLKRGATAERLLNGAPCAVALVPEGFQTGEFATIGAGFVDSAEGRAAVHEAHALAASTGARLRSSRRCSRAAWSDAGADELRAQTEAAAEAAMSGLLGAPVDVDVDVIAPEDMLIAASGELDLLVCGTRGYGPRPARCSAA